MIKIIDFGALDRYTKRELLKIFQLPSCKYVTYELSNLPTDYYDEDNLDDVISSRRYIYRSEINDILKACIKSTVFMYVCKKHIEDSDMIISETENIINTIYEKNFSALNSDLISLLNKAISYCFFADVDLKHYNYLKERVIQKNHLCFFDGAFHNVDKLVIWYKYKSIDEVVEDLDRVPCCYIFFTKDNVENYYAAFKIEENSDTYDMYIYMDSDNESKYREIIENSFSDIFFE